ncbi:pentatricopeptide repeat-containing protein At1g11290, chloroplastic [Macadamia integrifolia]|uniref:pentatricopeptide repeat-containing protein At1g11290, chloroplastic n=1 Tax=Macadamia integrifolia TaxID=60698 RepID=UPI001C52B1AA|nr:pentatricopeptide repeat-containing protein At1g11290, chloroplastic [Macadamia integrifolia]XP_042479193.1 pentatricopeptide repeat-containing protein At1g11290, chloroplastic [Macadamia integrifolia]XP_042479194.1 pentatricopeptide repeat-containing protein At1g11290, chloroplastic [Macadamia integrifolia]XP_042479195.1 pentatricopeptide repeat-containing protein At1g11290, chloroplastic [Macadamia integrifolia]
MGSTLMPFSLLSATPSPSKARVTSSPHVLNSPSSKPERLLQLQPYRTYIPSHVYCHPSAILLEICSDMRELNQILPLVIKNGLYNEHLFQTKLVSLFSKFGNLAAATTVFNPIEEKVDALYHTLLKGHAKYSSVDETIAFFNRMKHDEVQHVVYNFTYLLKTCGDNSDLKRGKEIHAQLFCNGFGSNVFAMTGIVSMYGKCGQVDDAWKMFDRMIQRDLVAWNAIIAGYAQNGLARRALELVIKMQEEGQRPDSITIVTTLPSCGDLGYSRIGKSVHGFVIRAGFASLVNVSTALADMYSKCGLVKTARLVFDRMRNRTLVSWNSMIDGYAQSGHSEEAMVVLQKMLDEGLKPTDVTIMAALHACADLRDLERGSYIHELLNQVGLGSNVSVMNSLITMYSKCKRVDISAKIFENLREKTLVSWNAMISGYSQNGHVNEALNYFCKMQQEKIKPDSFTMVSIIPAIADLSVLRQAKWIHGLSIRYCLERNVFVMTALVDMYAKCGGLPTARKLFDMMQDRHVTTWNAMIDGYGTHGLGKAAVKLFEVMRRGVIKPNDVTFLCVLSACSHAGLVEDGCRCFTMMKSDYGIEPVVDHYGTMVDLLGRAGKLDEAWDFIQKMPIEPGISVFGAMLGACRIHKNVELGEKAAERLFDLGPEEGGYHVLLSNIYANASMWDNVAKVRTMMEKKGLQKTPGCSLVELRNEVHTFYSGSTDHPQSKRIYTKLEVLGDEIKAAGYVPVTNSIHDVEDEVKEQLLNSHSEKLAIAFALINTNPGTTIHIRKNLRVCGDCHEATKYISLVTGREIIVRDMQRFHHFKNGTCSCADYW